MSAPTKSRRKALFNIWLASQNNATIQRVQTELNKYNKKSIVEQFRRKQYKNTAKKWLTSQNNNETAELEEKLIKNPKKSSSQIYPFSNHNVHRLHTRRAHVPIETLQNQTARMLMPSNYLSNSSDTNNYYDTNNENWTMVPNSLERHAGGSRRRTYKKKR